MLRPSLDQYNANKKAGRRSPERTSAVGTFRTSRDVWLESVMRFKADIPRLLILHGSGRTSSMYGSDGERTQKEGPPVGGTSGPSLREETPNEGSDSASEGTGGVATACPI